MLKSITGTNQYYKAMRVKFLAQGNNESLRWGSKPRQTDYKSARLQLYQASPRAECRKLLTAT